MCIKIDKSVSEQFPELKVFHKKLQLRKEVASCSFRNLSEFVLSDEEYGSLVSFRETIAKNNRLAVERLQDYKLNDLPKSDPLTTKIVLASYGTKLPITVFDCGAISEITICIAKHEEKIQSGGDLYSIPMGSIIARAPEGVIGHFGIKSADEFKLSTDSTEICILSFGCTYKIASKSKKAIDSIYNDLIKYNGGKYE